MAIRLPRSSCLKFCHGSLELARKQWQPKSRSLPQSQQHQNDIDTYDNANMRIVEVIIDGFKSYAVRTVISGWDDSFSASYTPKPLHC